MKKKEIIKNLEGVRAFFTLYPDSGNKIEEIITSLKNGGTRIVNYDKEIS